MALQASVFNMGEKLPGGLESSTALIEESNTPTFAPHNPPIDESPPLSVLANDMCLPRIPEATAASEKPLPSLPIQEVFVKTHVRSGQAYDRPETPRRATAPESPHNLPAFSNVLASSLPFRSRARSPYSRGHTRSRSSQGPLSAPQMARAHSSPVPDSQGHFIGRPSSPLLGPSSRHRSPMRKPSDETFCSFGNSLDIDQTISETSELDLTPRITSDYENSPSSPSYAVFSSTFPRSRRRPTSPLSTPPVFASATGRGTLRASTSTPQLAASRYNESYPSQNSIASSSIPSTPTSLRSRSPSMSSLETIEDSPDAEAEAEQLAKLKAAADQEEQNEDSVRRRVGTDVGLRPSARGDKRKRWSVCGAEGRADLNLETIWET